VPQRISVNILAFLAPFAVAKTAEFPELEQLEPANWYVLVAGEHA
jgi:hypothetical protein